MQHSILYGSTKEGIACKFNIENDKFLGFADVQLICFGTSMPIEPTKEFYDRLKGYCIERYEQGLMFKRLEVDFMNNLRDTVKIQDMDTYMRCLQEYNQRLEGDDRMPDMNGDLQQRKYN